MITVKSLVPMKKKVGILAEQVSCIVIAGERDMKHAVSVLSEINRYADSVKEQKEKLTKPINESLKNIRAMFKPLEESYEGSREELRAKMTAYQTAEVERVRKEEAKIAERAKPGRGNLSVETAVKKIEAIETPDKEVATDAGLVQFREVKRFEVVDETKVPQEFLMVDEKKIGLAMKAGVEVEGVRYFVEQIPVNYR